MADEQVVTINTDTSTVVTPPAPAPAPGTPPVAPWYEGADAATIGHIQTKGWHEKPANEVALAAIRAHQEAERYIGTPADQILKVPKDATDAAGWATLWERLGKPKDATGYKFEGLKFTDGTEVKQEFTDFMRTTAAELNMPAETAASLATRFVKYLDGADVSESTDRAAKLVLEKADLAKEWGPNQEANLFVAKQAASKLGIAPEAVAALEGQVGYAAVMKMFQKIGTAIGEDKFVSNGNTGLNNGVMTREQAVARKGELMADQDWVKRYQAGGTASKEFRELQGLLTIITSE